MKYILFDQIKNGDLFTSEFNVLQEATTEAKKQWERLSEKDKTRREFFYIIESINPNIEAENHYDGNIIYKIK